MTDCRECIHAEWDCLEYYNTTQKNYFVCGCKVDGDPEADKCELMEVEECQDS
jgi:hypothetical protein